MKRVIYFLTSVLIIVSCNKIPTGEYPVDLDNFNLTKSMTITPPTGMVTVVTQERVLTKSESVTDTICITGVPMEISVNSFAKVSTSNVPLEEFPAYKNKGTSYYHNTLCFEDTYSGDYDYNDLVLFVKAEMTSHYPEYKVKLTITPVAFGGAHTIGFGFETFSGSVHMITDDCRAYFFNGDKTFGINTVKEVDPVAYPKIVKEYNLGSANDYNNTRINYFITVNYGNGVVKKHYVALNSHQAEYLPYSQIINEKNMPYGIALPWLFPYPKEYTHMNDTYTQFNAWVEGKVDRFDHKSAVQKNLYRTQDELQKALKIEY